MDGDEYRALLDRCLRLQAGQDELRDQLGQLTLESGSPWCFPGAWNGGDPYRRVLELMGSAVFVSSVPSLQIVYWNPAAETLYGWKEYEVIGRSDGLLAAEDYHYLQLVMDMLKTGQSWSGQFPLKKKSGEILMAMMTKSPLYEDGELSGFITVSNDAALLDVVSPKIVKPEGDRANGLPRPLRVKFRRVSWHPKPLLPPVPIPSSVSNLASKALPRKFGDRTYDSNKCTAGGNSDSSEKAGKMGLAAKFLEKLHIKVERNQEKDGECFDASNSSSGENHKRTGSSSLGPAAASALTLSNGCNECDHLQLGSPVSKEAIEGRCLHATECIKVGMQEHKNDNAMQSSGESVGGSDSTSRKGNNDLSAVADCEIQWGDLLLGEEIGQGSFAKVYHGIWKGSDVAIKVFVGNEYSEDTLLEYKKEIDIMKRLKHPNVLLFMGAAYSHERLAIITEFLPRGSLFRTIHNDNLVLDMRRRPRMALDVARGMSYLHNWNPPIIHRDLKSSNLLVDRNWTVKVADFGLSQLQNVTLLTTKSGRGAPQWMAPEVLRNEPSNEKCDVFSFGVILWELITRSIPWNHLNTPQAVGIVRFIDRRLDFLEDIDPEISALIRDCWKRDPDRRPSFAKILRIMTGLLQRKAATSTSTKVGDC